ncbi:MAG: hypothetical protein R3214_11380 [Christiangramia sp.]|nr:hypothetical protein [Christiangramia sp.]
MERGLLNNFCPPENDSGLPDPQRVFKGPLSLKLISPNILVKVIGNRVIRRLLFKIKSTPTHRLKEKGSASSLNLFRLKIVSIIKRSLLFWRDLLFKK